MRTACRALPVHCRNDYLKEGLQQGGVVKKTNLTGSFDKGAFFG
ncbi:MAG: hypothetical protein M2R45_01175 [Verrucomicrobia subdivision 3 bacterium]|nr:hypothetical protein [Limisphaerales bacterium]MCS1415272.1 hypothetical protein [Limisphaerales bacterium]